MNFVKLSEVCEIVNGGTPKTGVEQYWGGTLLWMTPKDLGKISSKYADSTSRMLTQSGIDNSSAKLIPENSVILSTRAPIGHLVINTKPMSFNQGCKGLIPKDNLDSNYLYYLLKHSKQKLNELGTGTTFPELSNRSLSSVLIPLPSIDVQKRIARKLDQAFGKIDQAVELTHRNSRYIDLLFKQELKSVFHNPRNETRNILDVCDLKSGTTIPKMLEKETGDILYVKVGDMNYPGNEKYIQGSSRYASTNDIHPRYIIPEGSIIFPKRGGAIATNKKRIITKPTIVDLNTMALIPKKSLSPKLLYFWFLQYDLSTISNGTSIPQINNYSFKDTDIAVDDDLMKQEELALRLEELHSKTDKINKLYTKKVSTLKALKQSMLGEAFSESAVK